MRCWDDVGLDILQDFFVSFVLMWIFVPLLITARLGKDHPARRWIIFSAVCALVSLMSLLGWIVPTISRLVQRDHGGLGSPPGMTPHFPWTMANRIQNGVAFLNLFAAAPGL